jgi:hypothetical protein
MRNDNRPSQAEIAYVSAAQHLPGSFSGNMISLSLRPTIADYDFG